MTGQTCRLVADIGGTNARFAIATIDGQLLHPMTLETRRAGSLLEAAETYLHYIDFPRPPDACIAVAGPVEGDTVRLTNHVWEFSVEGLRTELGLERLKVINDFEAIALALPALAAGDLVQVGGDRPLPGRPKAVLGPGTGLGVAQLVETHEGFVPIATEGGHASIGPRDESELQILATLLRHGQQLSREALLSGPGIERIYWALCMQGAGTYQGHTAAEIRQHAVDGTDRVCRQTLRHFCAFLGTAAGDQALCCGAEGGVYIAGGIVRRFIDFLRASRFRQRFEDKGPMHDYVRKIPVYVISRDDPGMIGAARASLDAD